LTSYIVTLDQRGLKPKGTSANFLCLTHTDNLEVLQPFLSYSQLVHLLLGQPPLPIYHLCGPGIQGILPNVSSKLAG
jgi:hypothetical protein